MALFNQYSLNIMSILFQLLGSFFLTLEAFGPIWLDNFFKKFLRFSNWARASLLRLSLIILPLLTIPIIFSVLIPNKILTACLLPFLVFIVLFSTLLDEAKNLRHLTNVMINTKKITPIGFIMISIGYLLQLITTIMQIS